MDKWAQRIIAGALVVIALSAAVYVLKPRPDTPRYQWNPKESLNYLFDNRTGTVYTIGHSSWELEDWRPVNVLPSWAKAKGGR